MLSANGIVRYPVSALTLQLLLENSNILSANLVADLRTTHSRVMNSLTNWKSSILVDLPAPLESTPVIYPSRCEYVVNLCKMTRRRALALHAACLLQSANVVQPTP